MKLAQACLCKSFSGEETRLAVEELLRSESRFSNPLFSTSNRKGYISATDLKSVFQLLGESVSDEEIQSKWQARPYRRLTCVVYCSNDQDRGYKIERQNKF